MIVPVYLKKDKCDERMIVELQGVLQSDSETLDALEVGKISLDETGKAIMTLRCHQLIGKEEALKHPFVLLKKDKSNDQETRYDSVALIKRKLIFKNRPNPILVVPTTA